MKLSVNTQDFGDVLCSNHNKGGINSLLILLINILLHYVWLFNGLIEGLEEDFPRKTGSFFTLMGEKWSMFFFGERDFCHKIFPTVWLLGIFHILLTGENFWRQRNWLSFILLGQEVSGSSMSVRFPIVKSEYLKRKFQFNEVGQLHTKCHFVFPKYRHQEDILRHPLRFVSLGSHHRAVVWMWFAFSRFM